ncbi:MmcQ/YjbR family DNA-binding protein [Reichenbachiella versicolor]|uniref:MmcQ/YjbR family DNA-binding protein n=1 Tax=Reichenbachiella versicolor TaxID=1821036 RepID=UPI000D6E635E|nr:MmcQ/YjbR family DNA-binding protein [Reichenbachiella versicolor]
MNIEEFRDYCLSKPAVSESFPFDEKALTFKVLSKMFAITDVDLFESVNLKCDPERALELRDQYHAVSPGYHMNKKHWNTILNNSDLPDDLMYELIDHSYELVVKGMKKSEREELLKLGEL